MKLEAYQEGKKIRRVIRMPNVFLRLKGKKDAKKDGRAVVEAFVKKTTHRTAKLESREVLIVSKFLAPSRERAVVLINEIQNLLKILSKPDKACGDPSSPIDIRIQRLRDQARAHASQNLHLSIEELIKIGERITFLHNISQERILCARERCGEKLQAYFSGVKTVINDYDTAISFDGTAFALYSESYKKTDDNIFATIEKALQINEESED